MHRFLSIASSDRILQEDVSLPDRYTSNCGISDMPDMMNDSIELADALLNNYHDTSDQVQ